MRGMDMGIATEPGSLAFFVPVWVSMMAAMMLPAAVPAVVRRAHGSGRVRGVPLFVGSYLAVWSLVGVAVYALYRPHGSLAAGVVAIATGLYELAGAGDRRTWTRDRGRGVVDPRTHATDVSRNDNKEKNSDRPQDRNT